MDTAGKRPVERWTNLIQGSERLDELQTLSVGHPGWKTATLKH
jgi:hypothetical protein